MSDFDLDRLGDVWRQQPGPAEMERLQRSAAAVARRARHAQVVDVAAALALAAVVIFLVAMNPKAGTVIVGGAAILILLLSNIRLRRVRRTELEQLTGSTEEMLDQSIGRVETTLRHLRVSIVSFPLALLVGAVVGYATQGQRILEAATGWPLRNLLAPVGVITIMGVIIYCIRAIGRSRRELERLRAMREAYRREQERSGA